MTICRQFANNMNMFILASQSPQRKKILKSLGISFKTIPSNIDEHANGLKRPHAVAKYIALQKALEVSKKYPDDWIIGCDTFVILSNGGLALKPKNRTDAKKTINLYRNSFCDVYSGLVLLNKSLKKRFIGYEKTRIYFRDFSDADIEKYLDSNEWVGRSGSMTIEGRGGKWIKRMKGDYWSVVGLPKKLLKKFLDKID